MLFNLRYLTITLPDESYINNVRRIVGAYGIYFYGKNKQYPGKVNNIDYYQSVLNI